MTAPTSVAFFGPAGTFTEEALLTQPDYAAAALRPTPTITDAFDAIERGEVDLGFVPIENGIEGTVAVTLDGLVFDYGLLIQREVFLDIHLTLLAPHGTKMTDLRRVISFPHAIAQCRKYLARNLPGVELVAAASTAEAARQLGEHPDAVTGAIAPRLAGQVYGLSVLAEDIEDHPENQTRFVAVAASGIPAPTGHDRTTIVCFQRSDRPGSLHGILSQFAARSLNLTKLESRPTKRSLGDYCFVIEFEGHIADEITADCLKVLHAELAGVKFLGSYPAAGVHADDRRQRIDDAWRAADQWIAELRTQID